MRRISTDEPDPACNDTPFKVERADMVAKDPFPMVFIDHVCLVCMGEEKLSREVRLRLFARKSTVQKHIRVHQKEERFSKRFECPHPSCSERLEHFQHFMAHAARQHGVFY